MPTNHIITLNVAAGTTSPLIISDDEGHSASTPVDDQNLTTTVSVGDTVTWQIAAGSTITKIQVVEQAGSNDLFSPDPAPADGGTSVSGTIGSAFGSGTQEEYTINYWINGVQYSQDPKLQMN